MLVNTACCIAHKSLQLYVGRRFIQTSEFVYILMVFIQKYICIYVFKLSGIYFFILGVKDDVSVYDGLNPQLSERELVME